MTVVIQGPSTMEDAMLTAVSLLIVVGTAPVFSQSSSLSLPPEQLNLPYMLTGSRFTATISCAEDPCKVTFNVSLRHDSMFVGTITTYLNQDVDFYVDGLYMNLFKVKLRSTVKVLLKLSSCPCMDLHPLGDMQGCLAGAKDPQERVWWYYQVIVFRYDLHGIMAMVGSQVDVDVDFSSNPLEGPPDGLLHGVVTLAIGGMTPLTHYVQINTNSTQPTVTTTFGLKDMGMIGVNSTDSP